MSVHIELIEVAYRIHLNVCVFPNQRQADSSPFIPWKVVKYNFFYKNHLKHMQQLKFNKFSSDFFCSKFDDFSKVRFI